LFGRRADIENAIRRRNSEVHFYSSGQLLERHRGLCARESRNAPQADWTERLDTAVIGETDDQHQHWADGNIKAQMEIALSYVEKGQGR